MTGSKAEATVPAGRPSRPACGFEIITSAQEQSAADYRRCGQFPRGLGGERLCEVIRAFTRGRILQNLGIYYQREVGRIRSLSDGVQDLKGKGHGVTWVLRHWWRSRRRPTLHALELMEPDADGIAASSAT